MGGYQAGGLRLFDLVVVVLLSLLKENLFTLYVCTQILLLPLTFVLELMYSNPRGPWLVI